MPCAIPPPHLGQFPSHIRRAASVDGYGTIRLGDLPRNPSHAAACPALSTSDRAEGDRSRLRPIDLSRAPASTSAGAPLHVAHPGGDARGRADDAAARQREGGARVRREARRLDRGAARAPAEGGAVRARHRGAAARPRASHRPPARAARHGVERARPTMANRLLCVAGEAPHVERRVADFPQAARPSATSRLRRSATPNASA